MRSMNYRVFVKFFFLIVIVNASARTVFTSCASRFLYILFMFFFLCICLSVFNSECLFFLCVFVFCKILVCMRGYVSIVVVVLDAASRIKALNIDNFTTGFKILCCCV